MYSQVILGIDPGTEQSGWCRLVDGKVVGSGIMPNGDMCRMLSGEVGSTQIAIEMIASYGMPVGREVFETCVWIGRFQQCAPLPDAVRFVYRKDVKMHLCGSVKAKDGNIRQALIDLLGPPGTKAKPGPTYGVASHAWAALAVAVTAYEAHCA